ncbi:ABC transporter permease [Ascidiimonas aurantiaca]|uniref:ABC transporter permease n=1 Tax=Ascidiimonas aurantiaca TaxID=1685432 RepID=UPI0030EE438C
MIKNYLKIALRSLLKNKGYSFLNIFGLAIGITCASLIFLWVEDEVNFNETFGKKETVYYVPTNQNYEGEWRTFYSTPGPLAQVMKDEIPGIDKATRSTNQECLFSVGDNAVSRSGRYADPDFLEIFSLQFLEGNAKEAFKNPEAIVISAGLAQTLFGKNTEALGKVIKVNDQDNYLVSGVFKDLPNNVSFPFEWVAPFDRFGGNLAWTKEYGNNFSDTFVELSPEADLAAVDGIVREILQQKTDNADTYAFLHSMKDWHLRSKFESGKKVGGRITYVRLFSIIAMIILLIACINFMNLATARSEKRANEVGVRKAIGSERSQLITQFLSEAMLMASIAAIVSVAMLTLLIPYFNILVKKELVLGFTNPVHILALLSITLMCGTLAGLYPAFYLSSFKPVEVLKGVKLSNKSASLIRKGLVVGQFTISIVFIISTILVYQQIQYVKNQELGYEKDQLISVNVNGDIQQKFSVIKQELKNSGVVKNTALSNTQFLSGGNNGSGLTWTGGTNTEDVLISFRYVSSDFFNTSGMEIIEGHGFSEIIAKDSTHAIITESFAKLMGEGSALGKTIRRWDETYTVIGVIKDYLYGNMYAKSDPVLFLNNHEFARFLYIKANAQVPMERVLTKIETTLKKHNPAFPFEYTFVDETFNNKFKSEQLVGKLSQIFAILAILISCLGLFGLAAYTAEQRSKEIGVRKVLGASVTEIVKLLSKDFLKLVVISIIIATPIAWLVMHNWLKGFSFRIDIKGWVFIIAGMAAVLIALATVSFQAIKAAVANPVNSLKTE